MSVRTAKLILIAIALCVPAGSAYAIDSTLAKAFAGRDVQITADELTNYHDANGTDVVVINGKVSIAAGADTFAGEKAVVWLKRKPGSKNIGVWCCVSGDISAKKGNGTRIVGLSWETIENGGSTLRPGSGQASSPQGKMMVISFEATGEVFVTAKKIEQANVRSGEFYNYAFTATARTYKNFANECAAVSPVTIALKTEANRPAAKPEAATAAEGEKNFGTFGFIDQLFGPAKKPQPPAENAPQQVKIRYPVNLAPAGEQEPNIEWGSVTTTAADGSSKTEELATVIGRFYLWQKQDEQGRLLEMQADNAVVFYAGEKTDANKESGGVKDIGTKGAIRAIYVRGDVVMTEGLRTIRADEMYYDFENKRGLAINATMRTFDVERGIPIYVRAARIRQVAEGKFTADNVVVTSSEFATPQISLEASNIIVTDTTTIDQEAGQSKDSSYDAQMRDIRLKAEDTTVFYWPYMRSNLERPDSPLKSLRVGNDNIWGTTIESRWFLSRASGPARAGWNRWNIRFGLPQQTRPRHGNGRGLPAG